MLKQPRRRSQAAQPLLDKETNATNWELMNNTAPTITLRTEKIMNGTPHMSCRSQGIHLEHLLYNHQKAMASFIINSPSHNLLDLVIQYPILTHLASYLSTLDLLHVGLANRTFHALVLSSPSIFTQLKRTALCDGSGLRLRQSFRGLYSPPWYGRRDGRTIREDESIEVKLYATKCDEAGALPCLRCGINVCEVRPTRFPTSSEGILLVAIS